MTFSGIHLYTFKLFGTLFYYGTHIKKTPQNATTLKHILLLLYITCVWRNTVCCFLWVHFFYTPRTTRENPGFAAPCRVTLATTPPTPFPSDFERQCFAFHSTESASVLLLNLKMEWKFHGANIFVYRAPPLISPLCCRSRRKGSFVTPTYVLRGFFRDSKI